MNLSPEKAKEWLSAKNNERKNAIQNAADILLASYCSRTTWKQIIPIELNRLAATLKTKIEPIKNMQGDAMLIPAKGGFRIVINKGVPLTRYRTSISHELVHTLFYLFDEDVPRRMFKPSPEEERFCFDVARRILVPKWHLLSLGVLTLRDPKHVFDLLTSKLKISRPIASLIVLQDQCIFQGVAARWKKGEKGWKLQSGNAYASPTLSSKRRKMLNDKAREFLRTGHETNDKYKIISFFEYSGDAAFIIVLEI